jgi:hypothetical protein
MPTRRSNSKKGQDCQNEVMEYLKHPGFRKDLTKVNCSIEDFKVIDSIRGEGKALREKSMEKFLEKNSKMPGIRAASAVRGDILFDTFEGGDMIIDIKNYASSQGMMKLTDFDGKNWMKSTDSNLRYFLKYKMDNFDFTDDNENLIIYLRDFYFSLRKNVDEFKKKFENFHTPQTIAFMSKDNFVDFVCFMENGFAYEYSGLRKIKGFISQMNKETFEFKVLDLYKTLKSSIIEVKLKMDDKGYIFIYFYDGKECVYIISQRGWTGKSKWSGNCSFIKKDKMVLVSKVTIPKN